MRIVYDDAKSHEAVSAVKDFMEHHLDVKSVVREENWMEQVQRAELKEQLSRFIAKNNLIIGDTVTHYGGIGNNCQYPVYYKAENELQQCCSININVDPFGKGYVTLEDYNGNRISRLYKIVRDHVEIEEQIIVKNIDKYIQKVSNILNNRNNTN